MRVTLDAFIDRAQLKSVGSLFRVSPDDPPHVRRGKRGLSVLLVLALLGAVAAVTALLKGHHVMGTTSEVSWGVLIATYVYFVVSSTGLCLVSSLGHVFGFKVFEPIARKAILLALVTLTVGFTVIATELEAPMRLALYAVISPNPSAPIWWMGALYAVYMVLIGAELFFLFIEDHGKAKVAGILSVIAALAAHSNLGAVFGLTHARPFWYGPLLPVYFIASALMCGAALIILFVWLGDYFGNGKQVRPENEGLLNVLRQLLALFIGIVAFFTVWKMITGVNGGHYHKYEVTMASLAGPLFFSFWVFEVFLGVVAPLWILLTSARKSFGALALAAGLPMLAVFVMRYNFVQAGQMFSLRPVHGHLGETFHYQPPFKGSVEGFLPYTPSLVEMAIVVGAIAAAALLYVGATRVLRVNPEVRHG
ncbi:MAG: NrfD/PsrC family molybdoenzyme membrane anchor subunit [Myxococcota bacterium]